MKTPKAPKPTPEQLALEKLQAEQLANLDTQENKRRKRLLLAVQGVRAYKGSPILRAAPGDAAGTGAVISGRGGSVDPGAAAAAGLGAYAASPGGGRSMIP